MSASPRPRATASRSSCTTSRPGGRQAIWSWRRKSFAGRVKMAKMTGLGKGMAALLPGADDEGNKFFSCPIEEIRPNRSQPRKTFTSGKLEEVAASIREKGIIQPLVVRRKTDHYELIAGERRWRAAQKAGLR